MIAMSTDLKMLSLRKSREGFSLTELLIAISIIGILAAVATLSYSSFKDNQTIDTIHISLNSIKAGFLTCTLRRQASDCNTLEKINAKVQDGFNSPAPIINGSNVCFEVSKDGFKGCFDSSETQSTKANIKNKTSPITCNTQGACT